MHTGSMRWLSAKAKPFPDRCGYGLLYDRAAHLVGPNGYVHAYEIDQALVAGADQNLAHMPWVTVYGRTGIADDLPKADAVYVNAGTTQPSWGWLDAMKSRGRLLFPLHAEGMVGGMLLIRKPEYGATWPARFISAAAFVSLVGGQNAEGAHRLNAAFVHGGKESVQSFRVDEAKDADSLATVGGFRPRIPDPHLSRRRRSCDCRTARTVRRSPRGSLLSPNTFALCKSGGRGASPSRRPRSGTKRKCRNTRGISEAGGRPAVQSACRPQPPLTLLGPQAALAVAAQSEARGPIHPLVRAC